MKRTLSADDNETFFVFSKNSHEIVSSNLLIYLFTQTMKNVKKCF